MKLPQFAPTMLAVIALAIWSGAVWGIAAQHSQRTIITDRMVGLSADQARIIIQRDCLPAQPVAAALACVDDAMGHVREEQRSALDLQAQQDMAQWAFIMVALTLLQAVIGGVGLFFIVRSFRQSADTADLARRAYTAEHRTWLKAEIQSVPTVVVHAGGLSATANVTATNVGSRPAVTVLPFFEIYVTRGRGISNAELPRVVERYTARAQQHIAGTVLLPAEGFDMSFSVPARGAEENDAWFAQKNADDPVAAAALSHEVCIIYGVVYRTPGVPDVFHFAQVSMLVPGEGGALAPRPGPVTLTPSEYGVVELPTAVSMT